MWGVNEYSLLKHLFSWWSLVHWFSDYWLCQCIWPGSLVATIVAVIVVCPSLPSPSSSFICCYLSASFLNMVWILEISQNEIPMGIIPNCAWNIGSQHHFNLTSKHFIYCTYLNLVLAHEMFSFSFIFFVISTLTLPDSEIQNLCLQVTFSSSIHSSNKITPWILLTVFIQTHSMSSLFSHYRSTSIRPWQNSPWIISVSMN